MPRILCFGDSLTEGYTFQDSGEFHPYSIRLRQLLQESHCGQVLGELVVDTEGVSGEMVVPSMTSRLDGLLRERRRYDWVLILGGTNDLGSGLPPEQLLPHLLQLHARARESGARTLALAVPQFALELDPRYQDYRSKKKKVHHDIDPPFLSLSLFLSPHPSLPPHTFQKWN